MAKKVLITIEDELLELWDDKVRQEGTTRSKYVASLLRESVVPEKIHARRRVWDSIQRVRKLAAEAPHDGIDSTEQLQHTREERLEQLGRH